MSNICELLINVVKYDKPKVLKGLDQKVKGKVKVLYIHLTQSIIPSAERQALTHLIELAEHGKPKCLHLSVESDPQGEPIGKWVKDAGESEGQSVMGWIGIYILT